MAPNAELMAIYGTEDVFREKTAEGTPFAAKVLFAMVAMRMARNYGEELQNQRLQAQALNDRFQDLQRMNLGPTRDAMQHTTPKAFVAPMLPAGGPQDPNAMMGIPLGWDQGMVRTASVARLAGADMAKTALGMPPVVPALQKGWQALRGAVSGGAGKAVGALKSVGTGAPYRAAATVAQAPVEGVKNVGRGIARNAALGIGAAGLGAFALGRGTTHFMSREQPTPTYGATAYGAPQLAYGVNEYGQPQLGAPFIQ